MKRLIYISRPFIHTAFGIVIAMMVLTETIAFEVVAIQGDSQEQNDNTSQSTQQLSQTDAIPSYSFHIKLDYQYYLLREVSESIEDEDQKPGKNEAIPVIGKALTVLFRTIISPNAP